MQPAATQKNAKPSFKGQQTLGQNQIEEIEWLSVDKAEGIENRDIFAKRSWMAHNDIPI
ncbi:hypothetical protein TUM4630_07710 [Shewanella algidipiscicola]|uniref:Uncharacterized protein n=1 Tax=Shewanella algidipiscicola TaxID=614070 RepID=A0ABQ4P843_9GAMM|nr:hypothetical protein TUM4630_07710 [Shewanella algidipiscicola]